MAAVVIPGQSRRWGNESTNFYQASTMPDPGVPSRQKEYRCTGHQYTNSGHYHVGTKAVNQNPPLDQYGAPSTYRLRPVDQRVPRALASPDVHLKRLTPDRPENMYQSHQQSYTPYAMAKPSPMKSQSADNALARSLSNAFYVTSYQSDIARHAGNHQRSNSASEVDRGSLTGQLDSRRNSISTDQAPLPHQRARPARISSAPPTRPRPPPTRQQSLQLPIVTTVELPSGRGLQRRRSFSATRKSYPSRGEMLKEIFTVFPSPKPQPVSRRASRPSSAVSLRTGKIPSLREPAEAWV